MDEEHEEMASIRGKGSHHKLLEKRPVTDIGNHSISSDDSDNIKANKRGQMFARRYSPMQNE